MMAPLIPVKRTNRMEIDIAAIVDFVSSNRKALAAYLRQKLVQAGAKPYVDQLGKSGIERMESEAAGVLVDLACAMLRRLHPGREFQAEALLMQFPEDVRQHIHLPRSDAFHAILAELEKRQRPIRED
jgi:hypothetical protein